MSETDITLLAFILVVLSISNLCMWVQLKMLICKMKSVDRRLDDNLEPKIADPVLIRIRELQDRQQEIERLDSMAEAMEEIDQGGLNGPLMPSPNISAPDDNAPEQCECHERDGSFVCDYCYRLGRRGHCQS